jgi:hypothetical protein
VLALVHAALLWTGTCAPVAPAQEVLAPVERTERTEPSVRALDRLRERMQTLPPEKRARLERSLDEFEKLPVHVRVRLLERALALRERERAVDGGLSPELRRRLDELDAERARELWVAHLRERFREHGRELRERLPENLRRRLERAPPEARRRFLERLFEARDPVSRKALERMRVRWGLSEREIRELERLPLSERLHAMLEMRASAAAGEGG